MRKLDPRSYNLFFQVGAVLLALLFTILVLIMSGAPPLTAFGHILKGSFGSFKRISDVLVAWVPLMLVTTGLLATFTAGQWNIGIEGQITMGAIFTTAILRLFQDMQSTSFLVISLAILAGVVGGVLWAALVGVLKTYGGVNEIFGGLGLNFVATTITLWLIFGPWKRPGVASMAGTEPFPDWMSLPVIRDLRLSPWALLLAIIGLIVINMLIQATTIGLRLKAVGKNIRAAFLLGVPTTRFMMFSYIVCGALGGLAGALQVTAVYHRLIPSISSGYGYMGLMVAMLINYKAIWLAPVALFFAALNIGSIQLPIMLELDSTLAGVLQGALVLFVLIMDGVRQRLLRKTVRS